MNELWEKAWAKETEGLDFSIARVAGRSTIANPNKEDAVWWNTQGSKWVDNYISWRKKDVEKIKEARGGLMLLEKKGFFDNLPINKALLTKVQSKLL